MSALRGSAVALVDCNSFYASCETVFRPDLRGRPVVVLSNNDGCVIARNREAKPLVEMGAPFFEVRDACERQGIAVFSSNYELYGDMSRRVMECLETFAAGVEVYSIDEMFLTLPPDCEDWTDLGAEIRDTVQRWTGIPVGVGIAQTKTLAKLANRIAKATGVGTLDLRPLARDRLDAVLREVPTCEVWGIARRLSDWLAARRIVTALDLSRADPLLMREQRSVCLERTVRELRGESCIALEDVGDPKKGIISSRMFGQKLTAVEPIKEAAATYATRAVEKLRSQGSVAGVLETYLSTGRHAERVHSQAIVTILDPPTADVARIAYAATRSIEELFREGFHYAKCGVMLAEIGPHAQTSFLLREDGSPPDRPGVSAALDAINAKHGRGTLRLGSTGATTSPWWGMRREFLSPCYSTRWKELRELR